jgi:hypothetical protein
VDKSGEGNAETLDLLELDITLVTVHWLARPNALLLQELSCFISPSPWY